MYCTARLILMGRRPSFTTLAKPTPMGTVQTSSDGAFQFARILPEYPRLQPSPKKSVAIGCRFIWFVSGRPCWPPIDHHCWGNTPMKYCLVRYPTTTLGPSWYLPWPVKCDVAVGKMAVGPAPRTHSPEFAGESSSSRVRSPSPASRANSLGDGSCGTMLYQGITGRVIRFQSLVRLTGRTGWKFQLLFHWPLFNSKLL